MLFIALLASYLLGSIPFGLLLTRAAGLGDIRDIGSGNIGATNVLRTGNKKLAAATLLLDVVKGYAAIMLAKWLGGGNQHHLFLAALLAVLGHVFPVWLHFRGGKGVATAIGVICGLNFMLALSIIFIWLAIFSFWRISSVASLSSFALVTASAIGTEYLWFMVLLTTLLFYTHRQNIRRIITRTEPRFGKNP